MSDPAVPRPRRWLLVTAGVVSVAVAAAWFVRTQVLRDEARPVPVGQVVEDFRDARSISTPPITTTSPAASGVPAPTPTAAGTVSPADRASTTSSVASTSSTSTAPVSDPPPAREASPALAEPGVYRYRTTGAERIDALGGTSHDYPAETTITVLAEGCGIRLRWDALRERREEWSLCGTAEGVELQPSAVQYHEFFGRGEEELLTCDLPVLLVPADGRSREAVGLDCRLADDPWAPTWEVLGTDVRAVAGEDVTVRHVRMTIDDDDEYWEQQTADWFLLDSGLPVEIVVTKTSRSPSIVGAVEYAEDYRLELISLVPLR